MAYNYNKKKFYIIQSIAGGVLLALGIILSIFTQSKTASFAIMLGGVLCATGFLSVLMMRLVYTKKEKEKERRKENIEAADERSRTIREKSAWATQRVMLVALTVFAAVVTFVLPFDISLIIFSWCALIANAALPYIFAYIYSKRY